MKPNNKSIYYSITQISSDLKPIAFFFLIIFSIINIKHVSAQKQTAGIPIGAKVPDQFWTTSLNSPDGRKIEISKFKGKLLILDFWATWCSPCIAMIPRMDSLQNAFSEKVKFLSISYEKREVAQAFLANFEKRNSKKYNISNIFGDKTLGGLFPHQALPHYVWINSEGIVLAITGYDQVTSANISSMLTNPNHTLPSKKEDFVNDKADPKDKTPKDDVMFSSSLKKYKKGLPSLQNSEWINDSTAFKYEFVNQSIYNLFLVAYGNTYNNIRKVSKIEVKDTAKVHITGKGQIVRDWLVNNAINYELIIPKDRVNTFYEYIRQDLSRMFPQYRFEKEKKLMDVLVLRTTGNAKKFVSKAKSYSLKGSSFGIEIIGGRFDMLIDKLNSFYLQLLKTPIVDETNYTGWIDVKIEGNMSSVDSINASLKAYELELVPAKREVDFYVLRDAVVKTAK